MNLIDILYEDDEIYVINKPSGLSVQGGANISHSLDVDFAKQTGQKVYLVHRLDKDTSGLMIVAKNPMAANKWTNLIGGKAVKKEYYAFCTGNLKEEKGIIREDVEQHGKIKEAVTNYCVEKECDFSVSEDLNSDIKNIHLMLVRLVLDTGRMHQIRIHLAKNGCPIAGDDLHGNFKINKLLKKALKIKKLCLASVKLTFENFRGEKKVIEIPCPFSFPQ